MVISLSYSVLWSFSSRQGHKSKNNSQVSGQKDSSQNLAVINGRLNSISRTAGNLRRTMAIRDKVDSVLNKKKLSGTDSVFLENALLELKQIQQP